VALLQIEGAEGAGRAPAGRLIGVSAPPGHLGACLRVRVERGEVAHDHRHGQRDGQHARDCAEAADHHAQVGVRRDVAVAKITQFTGWFRYF